MPPQLQTRQLLGPALGLQPSSLSLVGPTGQICPRIGCLISLQVSGAPEEQPISGRLTRRRRLAVPGGAPWGLQEALSRGLLSSAAFASWFPFAEWFEG